MSFLHPEFLYYMLPPLLILFGFLLTQKESHEHFFSKDVMDKLRVSSNSLTLKARNALFLLMAFFMIIALAQPVIKEGKVEVKAKSADIIIALDISDSMLATDLYPNRLEAAKQKVLTLLGEAQNERIGVVAFAKNSYLVSPLSFDTKAVAFLIRQLNTASITEKGTDFLSVLNVVSKENEKRDKKYLLILSDGGDKSSFDAEVELAKKHNITVFVLGMATQKGSPIKLQDGTFIKHNGDIIISKLNKKIADLSTKTGGVYIEATTSSNDIKTMLSEITNISDKKELKSAEIQKHTPLFYYPLGAALFILLLATSSIKRSVAPLLLFCLFLNSPNADAGILDFMDLKSAKEAYENGEFEESAKLYEKYAHESAKPEAYFNAANAYYKGQKYKEAIESYNKVSFENNEAKAKNLSNLGNAYVKEANQGSLQKAKESYEKSLSITEDHATRENLKEVEKLLENLKEESNEEKKESQDKKKKSDNSKDTQKKESSKDESTKENKEKKSDDSDDQKEQKKKSGSGDSKEERKKDETKELDKKDENSTKGSQTHSQKSDEKEKMSDAEQQKWIEQLGAQTSTYLYKLSDEKSNSASTPNGEKPW
ncbi:MAG: VWA domain-containing protein [Sulfurimonas sp.]|nr:VWA domain-containing protein [Sulfurimonas sp.]